MVQWLPWETAEYASHLPNTDKFQLVLETGTDTGICSFPSTPMLRGSHLRMAWQAPQCPNLLQHLQHLHQTLHHRPSIMTPATTLPALRPSAVPNVSVNPTGQSVQTGSKSRIHDTAAARPDGRKLLISFIVAHLGAPKCPLPTFLGEASGSYIGRCPLFAAR
jgi:hypothetical protein